MGESWKPQKEVSSAIASNGSKVVANIRQTGFIVFNWVEGGNFVQYETRIMRLAWKPFYIIGFSLFLVFAGCAEKEPPVDELVAQADALLDAGQIESAIRLLERSQERAPERVDVLEALAFAYAAEGDPMLASMNFLKIAELVPEQPEYLLYAAESLIEAGDLKGAIDQYRTYLEGQPEDRAIWVTLADIQISQGRLNEALEALLAAEQVEPRAPQRLTIAELYLRKNNLAQAQAWFARALEGDPDLRDEALLGLLETAVRSRRFGDAQELLKQLDAEYPGRLEQSEIDNVRDQLMEWRQRREVARQAVAALDERGLAMPEETAAPEAPETGAASAPPSGDLVAEDVPPSSVPAEPDVQPEEEVNLDTTDTSALDPVRRQTATDVSIGPIASQNRVGDLLRMARSKLSAGDVMSAIDLYKESLVLDDAQPAVWAELSEAYLQSGNGRWAQATASEAMRRDPENPRFALQFLRAAQRTMDPQRLLQEMERAYRNFPRQPEIVLVLARAYAEQGNARNARLLYSQFLEIAPSDHPSRPSAEAERMQLGG